MTAPDTCGVTPAAVTIYRAGVVVAVIERADFDDLIFGLAGVPLGQIYALDGWRCDGGGLHAGGATISGASCVTVLRDILLRYAIDNNWNNFSEDFA